jgi:hypothetical protein
MSGCRATSARTYTGCRRDVIGLRDTRRHSPAIDDALGVMVDVIAERSSLTLHPSYL